MPAQYATMASHRFYSPQTITQQVASHNVIGNDWMVYCSNGLHHHGDRYYAMNGSESFDNDSYPRAAIISDNNNNDDGSSMSSSTVTTTIGGNDYLEERVQIDRRKLEQMISSKLKDRRNLLSFLYSVL